MSIDKFTKFTRHFEHAEATRKLTFPLHLFPQEMQDIIKNISSHKGYPIDFFAVSVLSAVGSAFGNSHILKTPNGYDNKANTFITIIAQPGINKSAPVEQAYRPLIAKQSSDYQKYRAQSREIKNRDKNNALPFFSKQILSDITPEALMLQLSENTRGCVYIVDELAGFFKRFNRYSNGGDEEMFLSLWQGSRASRDTLSNGPIEIDSPFLSIIGTIQPNVLQKILEGRNENGFADRWLFCYPNNVTKPYPQFNNADDSNELKYRKIINSLMELYDNTETTVLEYNTAAIDIIYKWACKITDIENHKNTCDIRRGILAKLQIYVHRFSLTMQMMIYGSCPKAGNRKEIGVIATEAAIAITEYFYLMAEKTRLKNPGELLNGEWLLIYEALPIDLPFKTVDFVDLCRLHKYEERTAKSFLKNNIGKYWNKLRHGSYMKI